MEGPNRNFDSEGDGECPEGNGLDGMHRHTEKNRTSIQRIPTLVEGNQIIGPEEDAEHLNPKQQTERSAHGVDHELERSVILVGTAPLIDEEVHRDETNFPEDKEDQEVKRHENAEHACFQKEEEHHVRLDTVCHAE